VGPGQSGPVRLRCSSVYRIVPWIRPALALPLRRLQCVLITGGGWWGRWMDWKRTTMVEGERAPRWCGVATEPWSLWTNDYRVEHRGGGGVGRQRLPSANRIRCSSFVTQRWPQFQCSDRSWSPCVCVFSRRYLIQLRYYSAVSGASFSQFVLIHFHLWCRFHNKIVIVLVLSD